MMEKVLLKQTDTLRQALMRIDSNALGIAFVVDEDGCLVGVLTDGDIRRGLLGGASLEAEVAQVMTRGGKFLELGASRDEALAALNDRIRIVPIVDEKKRPVDFVSMRRLHRIPVAEPDLRGNELNYVTQCLRDGWISSQGAFVRQFETGLAKLVGAPYALATSNGTTALHLALDALGIGPGDEVIVPDLTFAATINAVIYVGATPVLVDVERQTWNMDPIALAAAITERTKAIIVVHLYGMPARMTEVMEITRRHGLRVIEDAAEALGAIYRGHPIGSMGDLAAFSFFGNKLITTGEGGMLVGRDPEVIQRARVLRDHGMDPKKRYWHDVVGYNYRMTNVQAAIGVAQLERVGEFIDRKKAIATHYIRRLEGIPGFIMPPECEGLDNVYWLFSIIIGEDSGVSRDHVMEGLARAGIEARPLFYPMHRMPPYLPYAKERVFPISDWLADNGLSLPSSVGITDAEIDYICDFLHHMVEVRRMVASHCEIS